MGWNAVSAAEENGWWVTSSNSRPRGALCVSDVTPRRNPRRSSSCRLFGSSVTSIRKPKGPNRKRILRRRTAAVGGFGVAKRRGPMSTRSRCRRELRPAAVWAVLSFLVLSGCSSLGDLGKLDPASGQGRHSRLGRPGSGVKGGAPISAYNLTDDEHTLRDLAFPLIEPPYDRQRWDAVVYEWGDKPQVPARIGDADDPTAYYRHLQNQLYRSTRGALQPDHRRHPQRHRAHRIRSSSLRARSPISIGDARRLWRRLRV